jgi:hypothetical protein
MTSDAKIIFLHITKTAGGSLKRSLEGFRGKKIHFTNTNSEVEGVIGDADVVFGHLVYGVHGNYDGKVKYMAFIRHPLTRTVSHFYQLANVDKSTVGQKIQQYENINEFFLRDTHWEFENFMCKIISGEVRSKLDHKTLYKCALDRIENDFSFIGIQEMMHLSIMRLSHLLGGWIDPGHSVNIGNYNLHHLNKRTIHKIIKDNQGDIMLYNHVVRMFLDSLRRPEGLLGSGRASSRQGVTLLSP